MTKERKELTPRDDFDNGLARVVKLLADNGHKKIATKLSVDMKKVVRTANLSPDKMNDLYSKSDDILNTALLDLGKVYASAESEAEKEDKVNKIATDVVVEFVKAQAEYSQKRTLQ